MTRKRGNVSVVTDKRQMTQPKGKNAEPIEIPIPTKRDVFSDLAKTARPKSERKPRKAGSDRPSNKKH